MVSLSKIGSVEDRGTGGAGFGLAIARRAVAAHGGLIRARNVDPGLEVTLEIPLVGLGC